MVDYSEIYNGYWQRPDRMGESSFDDPAPIARQILATCGAGRILDVGSGMGALVLELLRQGADAYGVDVSTVAVSRCSRHAPGHFFTGSTIALPFPSDSFDTLISTDCLEHLAPSDAALALKEMYRVCRRNLFLRVGTAKDRDDLWHLTVAPRAWWESAAFEIGFRKHAAYYAINTFSSLEREGSTITIPLEKIPAKVQENYSLAYLLKHRELHMDMSRETGRRSDAHMARYQLVAQFVRDGDTILDAACGMGYGSWMLACQTNADRVIGADLDQDAIQYATENFVLPKSRLSYRTADVQRLDSIPDNSIDVFVSFETLEHVPYPDRLIAEAKRVLRPGGRFISSVPNMWVDDKGEDPNPNHLHVYDWQRLDQQISAAFLLEAAFSQIAGGGMKLSNHPRTILKFDPQDEPPAAAEWWLVVAMKDPVSAESVPYEERALHWDGQPPNVAAFARDYTNPWLVRGLVSMSWRITNRAQLEHLARQIEKTAAVGTVDAGAALCVLAYQLLDTPEKLTPAIIESISTRITNQIAASSTNAQCHRWVISLYYVHGLLWQAVGERKKAVDSLAKCAAADPLVYSPILATKTVDACRLVGDYHFYAGDTEVAQEFWIRGITQAEQAMHGNWREIYGDLRRPLFFGLREAAQVLDIASRCADNLNHLAVHGTRRGLPSEESLVSRLENSDARWQQTMNSLNELRSSPAARLQRALREEAPPLRRAARILYLLGIILLPSRLKSILSPAVGSLRRYFENR